MNVPHFEQELDYSCLAACTRMVLAFFSAERTEAELRALLKTRPGGTSPVNLMLRLPRLVSPLMFRLGRSPICASRWKPGIPALYMSGHPLFPIGMPRQSTHW